MFASHNHYKIRLRKKNFRDRDGYDEEVSPSHSSSSSPNSKSISKQNVFSQNLQDVGTGIYTRASDDDPSGIATYSQAGAKFGLGMTCGTFRSRDSLWSLLSLRPRWSRLGTHDTNIDIYRPSTSIESPVTTCCINR